MEVIIRQEAGYDLALYGFSLSYKDRAIKPEDWWYTLSKKRITEIEHDELSNRWDRIEKAATANAGRGKGHDKFLRQVMVWVDVEAPRYWWSEFDTYKVGTVAQSESTMHTLSKRDLEWSDFEEGISLSTFDRALFNTMKGTKTIQELKGELPESYLQRRLVTMNYQVLGTIINQRAKHKLPEWQQFIKAIYEQVEHPELLPENPYNNDN